MARDLISVVITTYNRKPLLKKAIRSVLAQSYENFELIVVDDCSPQDIQTLCKSFGDKRIRYIRTDKNYGFDSHPKNLGIKEAKGDYITFLDDDDAYRPDALKILLTYLKETDVDVVYGDYLIDYFYSKSKKNGKKMGWSLDFSPSVLQRMNFISMCVVMVKKSALLTVGGFDENVPKFKDWNLWLRLQKSGHRFLHIPIIVSEVSNQEESVSKKYPVQYDQAGNYLPTFFDPVDMKIYPDKTCLGERKKLKVAVYTLTWNRLELTKIMAKSLALAGYDFDWFVIDQGSTDGTVEWLKSQKAKVKYNEKNVGLAEGWNQAIEFIKKSGDYDIVIKVDNDAEFLTKDWLKSMIELFESNSNLILSPYIEGLEATPGGVRRQGYNSENPYYIMNETVLGSVPNIGGIVFAHRIGLFDEFKFQTSYEGNKDFLLCRYAQSIGYSCFYMEEIRARHQLGTSGQKNKYPEYFSDKTNDSVKV